MSLSIRKLIDLDNLLSISGIPHLVAISFDITSISLRFTEVDNNRSTSPKKARRSLSDKYVLMARIMLSTVHCSNVIGCLCDRGIRDNVKSRNVLHKFL